MERNLFRRMLVVLTIGIGTSGVLTGVNAPASAGDHCASIWKNTGFSGLRYDFTPPALPAYTTFPWDARSAENNCGDTIVFLNSADKNVDSVGDGSTNSNVSPGAVRGALSANHNETVLLA